MLPDVEREHLVVYNPLVPTTLADSADGSLTQVSRS
jgi:hypothetical protein